MKVNIKDKILKLKNEKNILILSHYYTSPEIQEISDFVGDSYYLSKLAIDREEKIIAFCGVSFMGESAKILSPHKKILLPNKDAKCPMANMVTKEDILSIKNKYSDLSVVCYINSTSEIKKYSDVCVTSSNAVEVINKLKSKNIFFIPDNNLGTYLSKQIPDKNFIFHNGCCPVHNIMSKADLIKAKSLYKNAEVLSHPECPSEILDLSDFIGSTSEIINYCSISSCNEFIICTEVGVLYELEKKNPNKKFYTINNHQVCDNMKKITLENLYESLLDNSNEVNVDENIRFDASNSLKLMHKLAK